MDLKMSPTTNHNVPLELHADSFSIASTSNSTSGTASQSQLELASETHSNLDRNLKQPKEKTRFGRFRNRCRPIPLRYFVLWQNTYDIKLFFVSFFYFFLCSYITCIANSTVDRLNPNNHVPVAHRTILMDPVMTWSYAWYKETNLPKDLPDIFIGISGALMIFIALINGKNAMLICRRTFYISGTVYLIRSPTVLMTILPNPLVNVS
jgi:hypothetical protein